MSINIQSQIINPNQNILFDYNSVPKSGPYIIHINLKFDTDCLIGLTIGDLHYQYWETEQKILSVHQVINLEQKQQISLVNLSDLPITICGSSNQMILYAI